MWPDRVSNPGPLTYESVIEHFNIEIGGGQVVRLFWVSFQCRGVLLIGIRVWQGPTALAVGAGGGCLNIFFSRLSFLFFLPLSGRRPDID